MAYTRTNYATKKALKEAHKQGTAIRVYQPGLFGPDVPDGPCCLEGPHYPQMHKWYASCTVKDGVIVQGSKIS
jgi:hypothetical protein